MDSVSEGRLQRWVKEHGTLWALELAKIHIQPLPARLPAELGEATQQQAGELAWAMGFDEPEPVLQRLASGRRCFFARVDGEIAAFCWVSQQDECIGELERHLRLAPRSAYIWNCVTLPPYRRQGLYSALLSQILIKLKSEGAKRAWIGTALANRPSIRGFEKAGFRPVVNVLYFRIFRWRFFWLSGRRDAPPDLVAAARRALRSEDERLWGLLWVGRHKMTRLSDCV